MDWRTAGDVLAPFIVASESGTLTFAPGETAQTVTIPIRRDGQYWGNEAAFVYLSFTDGAVGSRLGVDAHDLQATLRIYDPDPLPIGTPHDVTVAAGSAAVRVPIDLTAAFASPCCRGSVVYRTVDGTAHAGSDYVGTDPTSSVRVQSNKRDTFIEIPLKTFAHPGTFDLLLTADFPITRDRVTVTIVDDSFHLIADLASVSLVPGSDATISVSPSAPLTGPVTATVVSSDVTVFTADSTAVIPAQGSAAIVIHPLKPGHATLTITPARGAPAVVDVEVLPGRRRAVH